MEMREEVDRREADLRMEWRRRWRWRGFILTLRFSSTVVKRRASSCMEADMTIKKPTN